MKPLSIHLRYSLEPADPQGGAGLDNPLFDLLAALQAHGSIRHAANALGLSYRHVWGALRAWEAELGLPLVQWVRGTPAQLTPQALRLLWAERRARVRMTPHLEALRAELRHVLAQAEAEGPCDELTLFASHDPALARLQALAAPRGLHLGLAYAGSAEALRALNDGRCLLAGFHAPRLPAEGPGSGVFAQALRPLLQPGRHKLIACASRWQGLMFAAGREEPPTLRALAEGRWRLVNRQPGSGTRLLLEHLLQAAGLAVERIPGFGAHIEHTHVAVAAAVAAGAGDVGLGPEAAARQFGLAFVPLVEEDSYLVCLKPALETAPLQRLRALLSSPAWSEALATLPGYRAHQGVHAAGEVLSLTRALPWWTFEQPRRTRRRGSGGGGTRSGTRGAPAVAAR